MKACAGTAFAKLAHHSGAAVVPGFALWSAEEQRYILRFYPEIPMTGDVQEDTQRVHAQLESVIRQYPTSGFGFTAAGKRGRRASRRCTKFLTCSNRLESRSRKSGGRCRRF